MTISSIDTLLADVPHSDIVFGPVYYWLIYSIDDLVLLYWLIYYYWCVTMTDILAPTKEAAVLFCQWTNDRSVLLWSGVTNCIDIMTVLLLWDDGDFGYSVFIIVLTSIIRGWWYYEEGPAAEQPDYSAADWPSCSRWRLPVFYSAEACARDLSTTWPAVPASNYWRQLILAMTRPCIDGEDYCGWRFIVALLMTDWWRRDDSPLMTWSHWLIMAFLLFAVLKFFSGDN